MDGVQQVNLYKNNSTDTLCLRIRGKKHSPADRVFYISRVFSNVGIDLSLASNAPIWLLHLLYDVDGEKHYNTLLMTFAPIVSAHPHCARKSTCHVTHRARALSTKMNNDRKDGHSNSFDWI